VSAEALAKAEAVPPQCPLPEIGMTFAAGQLAVFQGASDEHI